MGGAAVLKRKKKKEKQEKTIENEHEDAYQSPITNLLNERNRIFGKAKSSEHDVPPMSKKGPKKREKGIFLWPR